MQTTRTVHLVFGFMLSVSAPLAAGDTAARQPSLRTRVADILEANVVGKTLHFHATGSIADGRVEYDFDRYVTYASLTRTAKGLRFDEVIAIKQANYDVVDGHRVGAPTIKDRLLVKTCELGERASTGGVVGFCRYPTSTLEDLSGVAEALSVAAVGDTLTFHEESVNYLDFFAPANSFEPGIVTTDSTLETVDGRLQRRQTGVSYKLDPQSMQRVDASRSVTEYLDKQQ